MVLTDPSSNGRMGCLYPLKRGSIPCGSTNQLYVQAPFVQWPRTPGSRPGRKTYNPVFIYNMLTIMPYKNKEDQYAANRKWYQKHREEQIQKNVKRRKILRYKKKIWLIKKLGGKCIKCGYDKCIASLDIHHIDPDSKDITGYSIIEYSWKYLREHLNDFTLMCANCHREYHYVSPKGL